MRRPPVRAKRDRRINSASQDRGGKLIVDMGCEVRALAFHPTRNLATRPDRFEIDPAAQFALLRRLRGSGREIVGCYHSHPNGAAEFSACDREGAFESDFLWLVAAITAGATNPPKSQEGARHAGLASQFEVKLAAFVVEGDGVREVPVSAAP